MRRAKVIEDIYPEKNRVIDTGVTSVKIRNSGKPRVILHEGVYVHVVPNSSAFKNGVETVKVITRDGRMFSVLRDKLEIME